MTEPRRAVIEIPGTEAESESESENELVLDELLVEEISIDGMCGVY